MTTIILSFELLLMTAVGIFVTKRKIVPDSFISALTNLIMKVLLPCLIFQSMISVDASAEQLLNCGVIFLLSIIVCFIQFLIGQIFYIGFGKNSLGRIYRYGILFTHYQFMGVPLIEALLGAEGLLYYSVFLIPIRILYYSVTKPLLTPKEHYIQSKKPSDYIKDALTNPCLIAVGVGLIFYIVFGLVIPPFNWASIFPAKLAAIIENSCTCISWVIESLGGLCSPLGLLVCGMTLGKLKLSELFSLRLLRLPFIRCVMMPLIFWGFMELIGCFVSLSSTAVSIVLIYSALPIASLIPVYVIEYDPDMSVQAEASGALFYSVLLSIITTPVWYNVATNIIS